jgi:DNA polymerase-3 subunit delta'
MRWADLVGHARQRSWFQQAIGQGRLGSAFLLAGPEGIGKRCFARLVAQSLLCSRNDPANLDPCGRCEDCVQVAASTHPDLIQISKPEDKSNLPLELIIGPPEARMREGLIHDISLKPYRGRHKVAILDDADLLGTEGANSLLKTLEEPPASAVLFLISCSLQKQLPTIRSRCQIVRFSGLSPEQLIALAPVVQPGGPADPQRLASAADEAGGSLTIFRQLIEPELAEFRDNLRQRLEGRPLDFIGLSKAIVASLDRVGADSAVRRDRLRAILNLAIQYYRSAMIQRAETASGESVPVQAIERCLRAIHDVDRNLQAASILEAWASDLARICHS